MTNYMDITLARIRTQLNEARKDYETAKRYDQEGVQFKRGVVKGLEAALSTLEAGLKLEAYQEERKQ